MWFVWAGHRQDTKPSYLSSYLHTTGVSCVFAVNVVSSCPFSVTLQHHTSPGQQPPACPSRLLWDELTLLQCHSPAPDVSSSCSLSYCLYLTALASKQEGLEIEGLQQRQGSSFTLFLARTLNALDKNDAHQLGHVRMEWIRICFTCFLTGSVSSWYP